MTSRSPVSPRRHPTAAAGAQIKGPAYPSSITPENFTHLLTKHDEVARLRFLYIDECLEVSLRLMRSECGDVLNVGSDEMVSINALVAMIASVADKAVRLKHIPGPLGVRGRNSDNPSSPKNSGGVLASPSSAASRRPIPGLPRKSRRRGSAAAC